MRFDNPPRACGALRTAVRKHQFQYRFLAVAVLAATGLLWGCGPTVVAGPPEPQGTLNDPRIAEASGLVASRRYPGLFYVHNDSGDSARVFVIDGQGRTKAVIELAGIRAVDFEDIALAPGAADGAFDVCVADIGDNSARRRTVAVHRFPEPELPNATTSQPSERVPPEDPAAAPTVRVRPVSTVFRYADGPQDAEAFVVDPWTGDGYILTKRIDGLMRIYRLAAPWPEGGEHILPLVRSERLPMATPRAQIVTAADISPDGTRLAVRCYLDGWEWRRPARASSDLAGAGAFAAFFAEPPEPLRLAIERQGEALAYSADGAAIVTVSEDRGATVWRTELDEATP